MKKKKRKHTINNNDNICVCFLCPLLSLSLSHFQILTVLFLSLVSLSFLISVLFVCLFFVYLHALGLGSHKHTHTQTKEIHTTRKVGSSKLISLMAKGDATLSRRRFNTAVGWCCVSRFCFHSLPLLLYMAYRLLPLLMLSWPTAAQVEADLGHVLDFSRQREIGEKEVLRLVEPSRHMINARPPLEIFGSICPMTRPCLSLQVLCRPNDRYRRRPCRPI